MAGGLCQELFSLSLSFFLAPAFRRAAVPQRSDIIPDMDSIVKPFFQNSRIFLKTRRGGPADGSRRISKLFSNVIENSAIG